MITVSLISHKHGSLVHELVQQLLTCRQISLIILTINVKEHVLESLYETDSSPRIKVIKNNQPKGFGANHNAAFSYCNTPFFCVVNPDIMLISNPFEELLLYASKPENGIVAPLAINTKGGNEDNARRFISLYTLLKRKLHFGSDTYLIGNSAEAFSVDWVSGLFMIWSKTAYEKVRGFDEKYFMYCEDVDICVRMWQQGLRIILVPKVKVVHDARRSSRHNLKYFGWHLKSMLRFLFRYSGRLRRFNR
jgi:N-acetylglucosaminyl-diphospho-decaprenol L-rhamnosyltransferase